MLQKGYATTFAQLRRGKVGQLDGYDHAWEVMFAYSGPNAAFRTVTLGPIPGEYPSTAIRQKLLNKHRASDRSFKEAAYLESNFSGDKCVMCRLAFGSHYDDPDLGRVQILRNRRNRFYCNICDLFIRACPGQAILDLPVLVIDVKHSRQIRNRPDIGLGIYPGMLSSFHRRSSAIIQKYLGFILNTIGDAIIAIWPSGFIPEELRIQHDWSLNNPAQISAMLSIEAVYALAKDAPDEDMRSRLPYKGALDISPMAIFSVQSDVHADYLEFTDLDTREVGLPLIDHLGNLILSKAGIPGSGSESEIQTGPAATDIAGEAVEVASELANLVNLRNGEFLITKRTDKVANDIKASNEYNQMTKDGVLVRSV